MNYKMILNTLGKLMIVGVILFMFPLLVGIIYGEGDHLSFLIPMSVLIVLAVPCLYVKP